MVCEWVEPFKEIAIARDDPWQSAVARIALRTLGFEVLFGADVAVDVRVALVGMASVEPDPDADERALHLALRASGELPPLEAVTRLAILERALDRLSLIAIGRPTVEDVGKLLRGVQRGLQEWTWEERPRTPKGTARQWNIDNEYHVQNLLWLVLAPVFPDLRREESTPQVGLLQPRADLGIPSLRLAVEAKFVKAKKSLKAVIGEIAADRSLYTVEGSCYDQIIAVIWDDGRRVEQHAMLVRSLEALDGVATAVVLSRPGKMPHTKKTAAPSSDCDVQA